MDDVDDPLGVDDAVGTGAIDGAGAGDDSDCLAKNASNSFFIR